MKKMKKMKSILSFLLLSAFAYYVGADLAKMSSVEGSSFFIDGIFVFVLFVTVLILHELGHYIGGVLTGYQFLYLRIFVFQWSYTVKKVDFSFAKFSSLFEALAGVAMLPPKLKKAPFLFFILGGVLLNAWTGLATYLLAEYLIGHSIYTDSFVAFSFMFVVFNLIPMFESDGHLAYLYLKKDQDRMATMRMEQGMRALMDGDSYEEVLQFIPYDDTKPVYDFNNTLSIIIECEQLYTKGLFLEARDKLECLYKEKKNIDKDLLSDVYREFLFTSLLTQAKDTKIIEELYHSVPFQEGLKDEKAAYKRTLAAYVYYIEGDKEKARSSIEKGFGSLDKEETVSGIELERKLLQEVNNYL